MIANWATEFVMVVSGFVLPRLISDGMGKDRLGIWDFGWLVRNYIDMSVSTLGSGAGYYVSRYSESRQWNELNRTLGAMFALSIYGALVGVAITMAVIVWTPVLVHTDKPELLSDARWLALAIGLASAIATPNVIFGGVLAGVRRFDLLNWVDGLCHIFVVVSVIACLLLGWGLRTMGFCVFLREIFNGVGRFRMARRVMPELHLRPRWLDVEKFREIFGFSGKTVLDVISKFLQNQISAVFLSSYVGPASVAIFSRSRSLILITTRFVMGYARVLVPRASSLREKQDEAGLRDLLIRATRYSLLISLPPALIMMILGKQILQIWMGDAEYSRSGVLPILVAGYLPLFAQQATYHILLGVASHGLAGIASLSGAVISAILSYIFVVILKWDITGAALAMALPVFIVNMFVVPWAGCRATHMPMWRYVREAILMPMLLGLPFAAVLLAGRWWLPFVRPLFIFGGSLIPGALVLALTYWRLALPPDMKRTVRRKLGLAAPAAATPAG